MKHIAPILVPIFLTFLITCKTQKKSFSSEVNYIPYYLEIYKADSLKLIGKNKEAFEKLDSLFKKYHPLNTIFIYEMESYVQLSGLLKKNENTKSIIENLVKDWGNKAVHLKNDSLINLKIKDLEITDEELENWEKHYASQEIMNIPLLLKKYFLKTKLLAENRMNGKLMKKITENC